MSTYGMKIDYEINKMNEINEKYRVFVYFVIYLHPIIIRLTYGGRKCTSKQTHR
jgi:hypothetical protein